MITTPVVPLFILEEHHEAFFIWNYGYFQGMINPFGNTLLHVDSHEDLVTACLAASVDELAEELAGIYEYGYRELGIASFIMPAIYRGIINNYTFLSRYDNHTGPRISKYIASYDGEGKFFKTGDVNNLLRVQLQSAASRWDKHSFYTYQEIGLQGRFTSRQPVILDIDLDYFSCDNSLSAVEKKIEITPEAYLEFKNNKYHPFRIMPAAALAAVREGNRYYLYYNEWQEMADFKKVSLKVIDKRINGLMDFLKNNRIKPSLIDICRSRFSGYTPRDQWQYIENKLLEGLSRLYYLEISRIGEFEKIYGGSHENIGSRND
ncbi:MAG: UPF0489 family protein [Peptococcaceae bacterium]